MGKKKGKQKEKYKAHVKSMDFYKFYSEMYFKGYDSKRNRVLIDRDNAFYVDYSTYCKVIDQFNKSLRDEILNNSFDFRLPCRLGTLGIRKKKLTPWINDEGKLINNLPVDWKATLDLWEEDPEAKKEKKLVRHYNAHTKGYIAHWYYTTAKANYTWKSAYSFLPCRTSKIELSKILKDEDRTIDYYLL